MSCCARCGQGICTTAGKIALNKVWHRGCFCCYQCNTPLDVTSAKIFYGEVFCKCCYCKIQDRCLLPPPPCTSNPNLKCRGRSPRKCVSPTPSPSPSPCPSSDSTDRARDTHSCSCIPACCKRQESTPKCQCSSCCPKRIHCRPKSPKPLNYPPRSKNPCFRSPSPTCRKICCTPPPPPSPPKCNCSVCCKNPPSCCKTPPSRCKSPPICCPPVCGDRCRRCKEKVFAAEKITTSAGPFHMGCFTCYCCCKSLCVKSMFEASGEIFCRNCYNNYFGINDYGYTSPC